AEFPTLPWYPTASHLIPDWRAFGKDRVSHHAHVAPPPSAVFRSPNDPMSRCPDFQMPRSSSASSPRKPPSLPAYPFCTCRLKASIPPALSAVLIRAHPRPSTVSLLLLRFLRSSVFQRFGLGVDFVFR